MIKVLHIVEAFCGGVLGALQGMVNGMGEGFEIYILHAVRNTTPKDIDGLFKKGTVLIRSEHLVREINPVEDLAAMREVRRVFAEVQPDVVHLHSSKAGAVGRLALNGRKVPVFYSPQGYSFLMNDCSEWKRKTYYVLEKLCGMRPSITVGSCKGEYDSARKVSRRATYIDNGINTEELERFGMDYEHRPDGVRVCTLGRIVPQKDPALFNRIAEAFPEVQFVWIGGGDEQDKLTSPNIEVTGWVEKKDALEKMMGCSVFLLTSIYEGLAFSIMEAMYFKRLCIVSRIPGNVDAIEDGRTGYICGTFEEYVSVIRRLLEDGIEEGIPEAAHRRVAEELTQTVMAKRFEELYGDEIKAIQEPRKTERGGYFETLILSNNVFPDSTSAWPVCAARVAA